MRRFDLLQVRVDEQGDADARFAERLHGVGDSCALPGDVQAAFGGDFLARFGHQAAILRQDALRDADHFLGDRHFEIHAGLQTPRACR